MIQEVWILRHLGTRKCFDLQCSEMEGDWHSHHLTWLGKWALGVPS